MNVFPIEIYKVRGTENSWFAKFFDTYREQLIRDHGRYCYTGDHENDRRKRFSYYEASAEFTSPTEVTVTFFDIRSAVHGGRGDPLCSISGTVEVDDSVRKLIEHRMNWLAEGEYAKRDSKFS